MIITSVEKHKKNNDMLTVFIDDNYAFSIPEEDYISLSLYEKKEITDEEVRYIKDIINFRSAKSTAVKYLSLKLRSERDVRSRLETAGYDDDVSDRVIEELTSMGYINDRIYTQKYIYDRSKLKPQSKKLLKYELQNKGIPGEIIDEALSDWAMDEATIAEGLVRRKFGKYDLEDEKVIKKVYSFLHHRGFNFDLIENVLRRVKEEGK